MNDLLFPLTVVNGDLAIAVDDDATRSQFNSYALVDQGSSLIEPGYGRFTNPQTSNRAIALVQELEKLNAAVYFDDIEFTVSATYSTEARRLNLSFQLGS